MVERGHLPSRDPDEPGMFTMRDPEKIETLVRGAGFEELEIEEMHVCYRFANADELWSFVSELQGLIAIAIGKLDDHERRTVRAVALERVGPFSTDGGYELPGLSLNAVAS